MIFVYFDTLSAFTILVSEWDFNYLCSNLEKSKKRTLWDVRFYLFMLQATKSKIDSNYLCSNLEKSKKEHYEDDQ